MKMERPEPGSMRYPAVAAVGFMAVIVGSIWWQTRETGDAEPMAAVASTAPAQAATPRTPRAPSDQARAFSAFAKQDVPAKPGLARSATADGMRLLAGAIAARGDSPLWRDRAVRLEEAATRVANAADSTAAAHAAREGLVLAGSWVADLPRVTGGRQALSAAAESIVPGEPLSDQTERVEAFFAAAAGALEGART